MKKKDIHKKQVILLECKPYNQQCIVVLNGGFEDIEKFMRKVGHKENIKYIEDNKKDLYNAKDDRGILFHNFPTGFAMIIRVQDNWIETVGLVAHECLHLTNYMFRRVVLPLTEESEEAYTYMQQKLITDILHKIY